MALLFDGKTLRLIQRSGKLVSTSFKKKNSLFKLFSCKKNCLCVFAWNGFCGRLCVKYLVTNFLSVCCLKRARCAESLHYVVLSCLFYSYLVSVPPRVTVVARKRPRSFCQKCWWQVTPNHTYTFDPTKSRADWLCRCLGIVWEPIRKGAHKQLFREYSVTVVSARWATMDWSWPKEWN